MPEGRACGGDLEIGCGRGGSSVAGVPEGQGTVTG